MVCHSVNRSKIHHQSSILLRSFQSKKFAILRFWLVTSNPKSFSHYVDQPATTATEAKFQSNLPLLHRQHSITKMSRYSRLVCVSHCCWFAGHLCERGPSKSKKKQVLVGGKTLSLEHSWSLKLPLASQTFTLGDIQASCVETRRVSRSAKIDRPIFFARAPAPGPINLVFAKSKFNGR